MSQNYMSYERYSCGEYLTRKVLYGYDAPTGGFFFSEFYNSKELNWEEYDDELVTSKDGLTLSELVYWLKLWYDFEVNVQVMIEQLKEEQYPTPLRLRVGEMFGKNISEMIVRVMSDLQENYSAYFVA